MPFLEPLGRHYNLRWSIEGTMNLHNVIKKMQQVSIKMDIELTPHGQEVARGILRAAQCQSLLAGALQRAHRVHLVQLAHGYDVRMN
jgi:hypothetical protein